MSPGDLRVCTADGVSVWKERISRSFIVLDKLHRGDPVVVLEIWKDPSLYYSIKVLTTSGIVGWVDDEDLVSPLMFQVEGGK